LTYEALYDILALDKERCGRMSKNERKLFSSRRSAVILVALLIVAAAVAVLFLTRGADVV